MEILSEFHFFILNFEEFEALVWTWEEDFGKLLFSVAFSSGIDFLSDRGQTLVTYLSDIFHCGMV